MWKKSNRIWATFVCGPRSDSYPEFNDVDPSEWNLCVLLMSYFWAHVHIACHHQSVSASRSPVKINKEESNNWDGGEWRHWEVSHLLASVEAELEVKYWNRAFFEEIAQFECCTNDVVVTVHTWLVCARMSVYDHNTTHTRAAYMSLTNMNVNQQYKNTGLTKTSELNVVPLNCVVQVFLLFWTPFISILRLG